MHLNPLNPQQGTSTKSRTAYRTDPLPRYGGILLGKLDNMPLLPVPLLRGKTDPKLELQPDTLLQPTPLVLNQWV